MDHFDASDTEPRTDIKSSHDLGDEKAKSTADIDGNVGDIAANCPVSPRVTYWRFIVDQPLITPAVLYNEYSGSGTTEDPYVVVWIDKDPRNPMRLHTGLRVAITGLVAILTLTASLVSSTYAGCIEQIMEDFGTGHELTTLVSKLNDFRYIISQWSDYSLTLLSTSFFCCLL